MTTEESKTVLPSWMLHFAPESDNYRSVKDELTNKLPPPVPEPVDTRPSLKFKGRIIFVATLPEVAEECEKLIKLADKSKVLRLGFDLEWPYSSARGSGKTALMQICPNRDVCYLFQIYTFRQLPRALIFLLRHPKAKFSGLNILNDFRKLGRDFKLDVSSILRKNTVELQYLARSKLKLTERWSLARLTLYLTRFVLQKPVDVRASDWDNPNLSKEQLMYAATDAYASLICYELLL